MDAMFILVFICYVSLSYLVVILPELLSHPKNLSTALPTFINAYIIYT